MVQSGYIVSAFALICWASVAVMGQLDHFLPPPPSRIGQFRRRGPGAAATPYSPVSNLMSG